MERRTFVKTIAGIAVGTALPWIRADEESAPPSHGGDQDFLQLSRELARETRFVIGVFWDPAFAGHETPKSLNLSAIQRAWGEKKDVRIVPLTSQQLRSYSILFKGKMDLLVYPYGPTYAMDAFPFYTGGIIDRFLKRGGAVLTTGGVPFGAPVSDDCKPPLEGRLPPDAFSLNGEIYERWIAPLGFKYYVHPFKPPITEVNRLFLPSLPERLPIAGCELGLVANISSHPPVPKPYHGNVFPERYPTRQIIPLFRGTDSYGQLLATNGLFVQDFEQGSRCIHIAHHAEPHPLSPDSDHFGELMDNLLGLLTNRLIVCDVEASFACFRQHEPVTIRAEFASFEPIEVNANIVMEIREADTGAIVDSHTETLSFPPKARGAKEWTWTPNSFSSDEYRVSVSIHRHLQTVSRAENGFVVWNESVVRRGPGLTAQGQYFHLTTSESFISGTNYYESTRGEIMWYRPDVARIAADLRSMRRCGVNYVRPHYHHLKWFKDYLLFQHDKLPPYFESLKDLDSPFPDERVWRIWDAFIYLCQKLGIVYGGDLFTLVPEEMGDPRGWFPLAEGAVCEEKRQVAAEFLRRINGRYRNAPGISWDLWNEPGIAQDQMKKWTVIMHQVVAESAPKLITVGGGSGEELGDSVDYIGAHAPARGIRNRVNLSDRPVFMQEVYLDHPEDLTSELAQAEDMIEGILASVKNGFCGMAAWSWTRQMRLWQDSYEHDPHVRMESWDDRLGAHTHDDGSIKPAGQMFCDLAILLRTISFQHFDPTTRKVGSSRGEVVVKLKGEEGAPAHTLHHVSGTQCHAMIGFESASWMGKPLATGPTGSYIFAFSAAESDLFTTDRLYLKANAPGTVRLLNRSADPRSVNLVDVSPLGNRTLQALPWKRVANAIEITVMPTQQAYWISLEN